MEYKHYRPQEVWLFYPDGGGTLFATTETEEGAELLVRLLNDNLARLGSR